MNNVEVIHQVQLMMDEENRVTVKSLNESFPLYLLGMVTNNPEYKKETSLLELVGDAICLFVEDEHLRPTADDSFRVNIRVHGPNIGIEDYTLFGFYQYPVSKKLSAALFDEELITIPEEELALIKTNGQLD